jgi:hypothetical protein
MNCKIVRVGACCIKPVRQSALLDCLLQVFARRPARAKGRTGVDGGDARRLLGAGDQPSRTSSTVDEEVRGGICRYGIRFSFESQSVQSTFVNAGIYHQARL